MACPTLETLEELDDDGRRHVQGCAKCRLERRWLELERAVMRRRAAREEVGRLLPVRVRPVRRWVLAGAVVGLVFVGLALVRPGPAPVDCSVCQSSAAMPLEFQSVASR